MDVVFLDDVRSLFAHGIEFYRLRRGWSPWCSLGMVHQFHLFRPTQISIPWKIPTVVSKSIIAHSHMNSIVVIQCYTALSKYLGRNCGHEGVIKMPWVGRSQDSAAQLLHEVGGSCSTRGQEIAGGWLMFHPCGIAKSECITSYSAKLDKFTNYITSDIHPLVTGH